MIDTDDADEVGAAGSTRPTAAGWARWAGSDWEEVTFSVDDVIFEIVRPGRGSTWIPASEVRGVDEVASDAPLPTVEHTGHRWVEVEVTLRDGEPIGVRLEEPTLDVLLDILRSTLPGSDPAPPTGPLATEGPSPLPAPTPSAAPTAVQRPPGSAGRTPSPWVVVLAVVAVLLLFAVLAVALL